MIDHETQIKIQALLDGELAESEAREIVALIARDKSAAALHAELKHTRQALAGAEQGIVLPESREFYWSKIRRDIERLEPVPSAEPTLSLWQLINRLIKPVAAVAAVVVLGTVLFHQMGGTRGGADFMVASADMDAITYRDDSDGTTYVWFADTSENDVAVDDDATTLD
jgi:anti-sigma factor RsiW